MQAISTHQEAQHGSFFFNLLYLLSYLLIERTILMNSAQNTYEPQLLQLEKELSLAPSTLEAIAKLVQIGSLLRGIQISEVYSVKDLLIKHLNPVSKDITNLNLKDLSSSLEQLQQLILTIVTLYAQAARHRFEVAAFELLGELLERSSALLKIETTWIQEIQPAEATEDKTIHIEYRWAKNKKFSYQTNTPLYYNCIETMMSILQGIESEVQVSGLHFIKEYINFIFKFSHSLQQNKMLEIAEQIAMALENLLVTCLSSKDFSKEFSVDAIKSVSNAGIKLCSVFISVECKSKFEMLTSMYGLSLLGAPSIEKKLAGLKIINKQSEDLYRKCGGFIKEDEYVGWLFDNKIIDLIFEESSSQSSPILKQCAYIFRIAFKRSCLRESNMQKVFDFIETSSTQNRQTILKYLELQAIRFSSSDYEVLLRRLKKPQKPEFYEQDLFLICNQRTRYSTHNGLIQFLEVLSDILRTNYGKFRNQKIEEKCIKSYVKIIVRLLEKETDLQQKSNSIDSLYDTYFEKELTRLGVVIFKNIFEQMPQVYDISKSKAANFLITKKGLIQKAITTIKNSQNQSFNKQIQQFLCQMLILCQNSYGSDNIDIKCEMLLQTAQSWKIFEKIVELVPYNSQQLNAVFEKLMSLLALGQVGFQLVKCVFIRINYIFIKQVKEFHQEPYFQVLGKVVGLKKYEDIKYVLLNANSADTRNQAAQLIADLYTNFPEIRTAEAEAQLQAFLEETLAMTLKSSSKLDENYSQARLLGYLALVQNLMLNTEYIGVGKYKPHNSLVPISTVQVKILNDITYGNTVPSYWKKVSSNMILFDLLIEIGEKFKSSAREISLQEGKEYWPEKWNGRTLEELNINDKVLKAIKCSKDKIRKEKLIDKGELTPKARKAFQEIYNKFAVDGKMGRKQCVSFVSGVTGTSSSTFDNRVVEFFREFDTDNDENITLDDFLRFYKHHCTPEREESVWKNLQNMRFGKDLRKHDDPIEINNQNLLYRSLLYRCSSFYDILFLNSQSESQELSDRCKKLLLRLPTYPNTLQSVNSGLDLISKNCFQTEYLLIAIQSKLNAPDQNLQERIKNKHLFIESGNFMRIYQMMMRIDSRENTTSDERKCLFVSLQILRSLLTVPSLKQQLQASNFLNVNLKIQQTKLFSKLAQEALKKMDIDIFEAALALQLTQNCSEEDLALNCIFHDENSIRKICCNYIFVLFVEGKIKVDLFAIEEKVNCQNWFETLNRICKLERINSTGNIITRCIGKAKLRSEDISTNPDDPTLFGNLSIIDTLASRFQIDQHICEDLKEISNNVLSIRSRKLIYSIMAKIDALYAIQFATSLIESVQPTKEVVAKSCYVGIKNLGSTCYMNSILQSLFFVKGFQNLVLSLPKQQMEYSEVKGKLIYDNTVYQLQKMYTYLLRSSKKSYNPEEFCLTIKMGSSTDPIDPKVQEDAHEFVSKFLDGLEKAVEKRGNIEKFRQMLEGTTVTQMVCKKCENKINREEKFSQISLTVQNISSLEQSFQKYIVPEEIEDYFCSSCNKKVQKMEKSTYLSKLPSLLMINLQRIVYDLEDLIFKKIDTSFSFPPNLNVSNFILKQSKANNEDYEFRLKAVIVHSGTSEAGHYYSIIRIEDDWFKFNDESVTKIDFNSIQHECFGGAESKEEWSHDLKFSTNAYMLFYEKKSFIYEQVPYELHEDLQVSINHENKKFYHQLQVHQESIFFFANEIFSKFHPADIDERIKYDNYDQNWSESPNLPYYESIYTFTMKLFKFSTIFYDVNKDYLFSLGQIVFKMFYLLPEKSYEFVNQLQPDESIQLLCLHNDQTIRNIYKHLLNKIFHVFMDYYQANFAMEEQAMINGLKTIDCYFAFFEDQRLMKNISKSGHFFDFWRKSCQFIPQFTDYLISHEAIPILINLVMPGDKKKVQLSTDSIKIMLGIIDYMLTKKKNTKYIGSSLLTEMSEKERASLTNPKFYEKLMNLKCDNSELGQIIQKLCEDNLQFSKMLVPIFLKGLNNIISHDSALCILNNMSFYLLLDDQYSQLRLKWILGIPQLRAGEEMMYGLAYEDESVAFEYISPLFFMKSEKEDYKTALAILYENNSTFNSFSVEGVKMLLNLMVQSNRIFNYIVSLPAPTYMLRCYIDWTEKYIGNFKESYFMEDRPNEKAEILTRLQHNYMYIAQKIKAGHYVLPPNSKIIGRNKDLFAIESIYEEGYRMTLWAHLTYTLPNLPNNHRNDSLPKQLFRFGHPSGFAKCFISLGNSMVEEMSEQNEQLKTQTTTYTLQIESQQTLTLKLKFQNFNEQIRVHKGKVLINFAYQDLQDTISSIIQVRKQEAQPQLQAQQQIQETIINKTNECQYLQMKHLDNTFMKNEVQDMVMDNVCPICTYINQSDYKICQMCDGFLD